jgi:NAD(P)-dependent dehydrogenase (short-subunit alcohol dehydrogenase family)
MTNGELAGQVAVVTGGGRGIGRAIATALADAGAAVAVVARTESEIQETAEHLNSSGGRAIALSADVTDRQRVEQMLAEVERQLGPLDLLVNDAGRGSAGGPTWELDPEEWWRDLEVNVRGTFLPTWAALPGMISRRRGRIINIASWNAVRAAPYLSAYASSKAAVVRFSESLAAEVQQYGIAVFALSPGVVRTALTEHLAAKEDFVRHQPRYRDVIESNQTFPPERAAELARFLASGQADGLSGRMIRITDDYVNLAQKADEVIAQDLLAMRRT